MKLFEILSAYNVLDQIPFKGNDNFLPNELKRKIVSNKIKYGKYKKEFESNVKEFNDNYITDEMREKMNNDKDLVEQVNHEVNKYLNELLQEDKELTPLTFSDAEYDSIVDVTFNDVSINGVTISAQQFLEILYDIFCNKND